LRVRFLHYLRRLDGEGPTQGQGGEGHGHTVVVVRGLLAGFSRQTPADSARKRPAPTSRKSPPNLASSVCRAMIRSVSLMRKLSSPVISTGMARAAATTATVCAKSGQSVKSKDNAPLSAESGTCRR
jgi:hypothetical protein